jgi:dimethylglycine dehydrogenase
MAGRSATTWPSRSEFEVPILGERRPARVIAESPYDPQALRGRM